jgi:hypothetical protein
MSCVDPAPQATVFFTQHLAEIVRFGLWAGRFLIACGNLFDKVGVRRRGGTLSRFVRCFRGVETLDGLGD